MSCVSCHVSCVICHVSYIMCHMSCVICHMSHVACHLSPDTCHLILTPTATATDPPPANSATMHSTLVFEGKKNTKLFNAQKSCKTWENFTVFYLANISETLFNQMSPVHRKAWFPGGDTRTDIATYRMNRRRG